MNDSQTESSNSVMEQVVEIPLVQLHPFEGHPFKVQDDDTMLEMAESIRQYGVLVPGIVRPDPDGGYEMIACHRRHRASQLAVKETIPVIVRDMDDDAAIIIMVDSNLQREKQMPTFRVERTGNYTVMSNHHLRNEKLSLKAKGLLSQMLSLPEKWNYTLAGLCAINPESKDAIRSALRELEDQGYVIRHQTTDASGKFSKNEYIIYEVPVNKPEDKPVPTLEKPLSENPTTDNPQAEKPSAENPTQLNTKKSITQKSITDPISCRYGGTAKPKN